MSFSLIPPEINSALMFSGAGSGPLLEAAVAWDSLSADLESTATQYQTLLTNLTTGPWLGPSSAQMAAATAPYIAWLQSTAATAAQTGTQAKAAAAAYQGAYASMVPLPVIAANRAELATLVANNFLGQNTGAIATNEAEYLDMWIQDALGMDTYQVNSQAASALPAQTAAPQVANGAMAAAAAPAAAGSAGGTPIIEGLLAAFAELLGVSSSSATPTGLTATDLTTWLGALASGIAADPAAALVGLEGTYYMGMLSSVPARMFMSSGSSGAAASGSTLASMSDSLMDNVGKFVDGKLVNVMSGVGGQLQKWGSSISASLASAQHLGGLSVPNAWHGMATDMARAAPTLPATSVAAPSMTAGLPSSPFAQGLMGALAGRGVSSLGSRVAAKVMPRSPAGG
ncbi:PPE family protein [Candidatus Mycobacterium methanotrophicum]|uniref:PPE family protein n=1 Tax=Candidatus Mycobacterium methanotrophicum TaxID=2943498 RepID=A0ABY4QGS6_9MYCO|nr:PPE family protein [Candidatus Mycobacterium methanotrophicum]UQX09692.1 PPE family protein [Candidatus Mycobacterium methanotrophicum]